MIYENIQIFLMGKFQSKHCGQRRFVHFENPETMSCLQFIDHIFLLKWVIFIQNYIIFTKDPHRIVGRSKKVEKAFELGQMKLFWNLLV